jgi:16S rRNA (cytosine1402-N4)-methyltransferase
LAEIIANAVPAAARRDGHPARKCFQAIRIAVNGELDHLNNVLDTAFGLLNKEGVLAIITFHSLEDRMVKQRFKEYCTGCTCPPDFPVCVCGKTPKGRLLTRKPIEPSKEELEQNPRSRSAKLRVIIKN